MYSYDSPIQLRLFFWTPTVCTDWSFWWKHTVFCVRCQQHTHTHKNTYTTQAQVHIYIYIYVYIVDEFQSSNG